MAFGNQQAPTREFSTKTVGVENLSIPHNVGMKTRGDRIRYIRTEVLGMESQDEMANELRVTRGAVSNWEQNRGIHKKYLLRLANLGNTTMEWIETGRGEAPEERSPVATSVKSDDDGCIYAAVEGMLRGFGLTDNQAGELRVLMKRVLQERLSGQTEEEVRNARKALAQFVTAQFLRSKGLKDEEK